MAEIEMERRPRRNAWIWVAAAVLILVLAVGAWLLFARGTSYDPLSPAADRTETTAPYEEPAEPYRPPVEPDGDAPPGELIHPEPPGTPD
jgi:hypothetical protein